MINREKLLRELDKEIQLYQDTHKKSKELFERAGSSLLLGHSHNWQNMWPGSFPIYIDEAQGCTIRDVDGNEYFDICLGDTGAMTGHSPKSVETIAEAFKRGNTFMLPTEDHV